MPPIQVHSDKPINPSTPSGTISEDITSPYPSARPGAAAAPAPTGTASSVPFNSLPRLQPHAPQPTRTIPLEEQDGNPPAPRPGDIPVPSSHARRPQEAVPAQAVITPAPTASETQNVAQQMPSQFAIPPPASNYAPTRSTTAFSPASMAVMSGQASLAHPPGYVQNPHADAMSAEQRAAQSAAEQQDSVFSTLGSSNKSGGTGSAGSILGGNGGQGSGVEGAWEGVKGLLGTAGKKLAEVEGEVWKRVTKE